MVETKDWIIAVMLFSMITGVLVWFVSLWVHVVYEGLVKPAPEQAKRRSYDSLGRGIDYHGRRTLVTKVGVKTGTVTKTTKELLAPPAAQAAMSPKPWGGWMKKKPEASVLTKHLEISNPSDGAGNLV